MNMRNPEFSVGSRTRLNMTALLLSFLAAGNAVHAESLYLEGKFRPLASDNKASKVGDVVTIQIYEQSSATTSTDTNTQRNNNLAVATATLPNGKQLGATASVNGSFDGGGTTQRANKLLATMTASIREVLPNGDLKVAGEQTLVVNDEQHKVSLEGRVRPQDISNENIVLSTRLADARIDYAGSGELSERQKRGLWRKIVDFLGL